MFVTEIGPRDPQTPTTLKIDSNYAPPEFSRLARCRKPRFFLAWLARCRRNDHRVVDAQVPGDPEQSNLIKRFFQFLQKHWGVLCAKCKTLFMKLLCSGSPGTGVNPTEDFLRQRKISSVHDHKNNIHFYLNVYKYITFKSKYSRNWFLALWESGTPPLRRRKLAVGPSGRSIIMSCTAL